MKLFKVKLVPVLLSVIIYMYMYFRFVPNYLYKGQYQNGRENM